MRHFLMHQSYSQLHFIIQRLKQNSSSSLLKKCFKILQPSFINQRIKATNLMKYLKNSDLEDNYLQSESLSSLIVSENNFFTNLDLHGQNSSPVNQKQTKICAVQIIVIDQDQDSEKKDSFKKKQATFAITSQAEKKQGISRKCNCSKTKCLKNYCECFKLGLMCTEQCQCSSCHNNFQRFLPPTKINDQKFKCKCLKSKCLKKYCECFNAGKKCGKQCTCTQCDNHLDSQVQYKTNKNRSRNAQYQSFLL